MYFFKLNKILYFFCTIFMTSILSVSYGMQNSSQNQKKRFVPKITISQLKMIYSKDQNLRELGWAAINYNLKKGAKPERKLLNEIEYIARFSTDIGSKKVLHQIKDEYFENKNQKLIEILNKGGIDQQPILELSNSKDPSESYYLDVVKKELVKSKPVFGIAEFMNDSEFVKVKNDFHFFHISEDEFSKLEPIKVNDRTSIKIFPGQLKSGYFFNLINEMRRSDGGRVIVDYNLKPNHTYVTDLQDFIFNKEGFKGALIGDKNQFFNNLNLKFKIKP